MARSRHGRVADRVFTTRSGAPKLVPCAVLFVDLLGVRELNRSPHRRRHLAALERAVTRRYRSYLDPAYPWPASFFSDTLVLAAPIEAHDDEGTAIAELVREAATLQLNLIAAGFFLRGALTLGEFHNRDGLIFGPALVEAAEHEHDVAVHPRIVLSKDVVRVQRPAAAAYPNPADAPHTAVLLTDDDGWTFIDYLAPLLDDPEDPRPALQTHRDRILGRLAEHRTNKRVWEKYRWAAEYHNAVLAEHMPHAVDLLVEPAAMRWRFSAFV